MNRGAAIQLSLCMRLSLQLLKKVVQLFQRHLHQVVQTQARQGLQLGAAPSHTRGHKALGRVQHRMRLLRGAQPPKQGLGFKTGTGTGGARRVAAVLGQQHPNVHLVRLGFQIFKKPLHAIPVLVPFATPVGGAFNHPLVLLGRELVPGGVARNACRFGVAHHVVLIFCPGGGLHGFDCARP